jgi:hypothetical protein
MAAGAVRGAFMLPAVRGGATASESWSGNVVAVVL